jgi:hypothetical protein
METGGGGSAGAPRVGAGEKTHQPTYTHTHTHTHTQAPTGISTGVHACFEAQPPAAPLPVKQDAGKRHRTITGCVGARSAATSASRRPRRRALEAVTARGPCTHKHRQHSNSDTTQLKGKTKLHRHAQC